MSAKAIPTSPRPLAYGSGRGPPLSATGPAQRAPAGTRRRPKASSRCRGGVQCTVGKDRVAESSIAQLETLTGDRDVAYSAAFARTVERRLATVTLPEVLAAEHRVISSRFNGSRSAYYAALARAGVSRSLARGILADELRRAKVAQRMRVPRPSAAAVASFYESYPQMLVRQVKAKPAPAWLSWKARGYALETVAPASVFGLAERGRARCRRATGRSRSARSATRSRSGACRSRSSPRRFAWR